MVRRQVSGDPDSESLSRALRPGRDAERLLKSRSRRLQYCSLHFSTDLLPFWTARLVFSLVSSARKFSRRISSVDLSRIEPWLHRLRSICWSLHPSNSQSSAKVKGSLGVLMGLTASPIGVRNAIWLLEKHGAGGGSQTRTELLLQRILRAGR